MQETDLSQEGSVKSATKRKREVHNWVRPQRPWRLQCHSRHVCAFAMRVCDSLHQLVVRQRSRHEPGCRLKKRESFRQKLRTVTRAIAWAYQIEIPASVSAIGAVVSALRRGAPSPSIDRAVAHTDDHACAHALQCWDANWNCPTAGVSNKNASSSEASRNHRREVPTCALLYHTVWNLCPRSP